MSTIQVLKIDDVFALVFWVIEINKGPNSFQLFGYLCHFAKKTTFISFKAIKGDYKTT